jgi:hypothetical protein
MIPPTINVNPAVHQAELRFWSLWKGLTDVQKARGITIISKGVTNTRQSALVTVEINISKVHLNLNHRYGSALTVIFKFSLM